MKTLFKSLVIISGIVAFAGSAEAACKGGSCRHTRTQPTRAKVQSNPVKPVTRVNRGNCVNGQCAKKTATRVANTRRPVARRGRNCPNGNCPLR